MKLHIDGTCVVEDVMTGYDPSHPEQTRAPYYVFDELSQTNVAGPYGHVAEAIAARDFITAGRLLFGVPLPTKWQGYKSAVVSGDKVYLYLDDVPETGDAHYRVTIVKDGLVYATGEEIPAE